jgi:large subunit ribosomal protein L23
MNNHYQVIKRPVVTEKSTIQKEAANQITFEVHVDANKIEIRKAVEALFKVKVIEVRTSNMEGKKKRVGKSIGKRSDWKKAVVRLKPGDKIEFFESA